MSESEANYLLDFDNEIITEDLLKKHDLNLSEWDSSLLIKNDEYWSELIAAREASNGEYFDNLDEEKSEALFKFAIVCLQKFVQYNFTGPRLKQDDSLNDYFNNKEDFTRHLTVDNEEINSNVTLPALLLAPKIIFKHCCYSKLIKNWWYLRTLLIHQKILDDLSVTLYNEALEVEKTLEEFQIEDDDTASKLHLELAQLFITFRNVVKTEKHTNHVKKKLGISFDLVGVLGKRTRYQIENKAQLTLNVSLSSSSSTSPHSLNELRREREMVKEGLIVPLNVALNDDVRLENISFSSADDVKMINLSNLEQKLLLAVIQQMWFSKPFDELHTEELMPYVNYILSQDKTTWCVKLSALLIRCKLEINNKRTKERCLAQIEEIINCFSNDFPHALAKIGGTFDCGLQPIWETEGQYGDMMFKIGLVKAALDVYLRTQMWEEVIGCYSALEMRHHAAKVIKEQLEVKETVKLWCWLGDAEDNESCYERAWKLSEEKSARAQRHWGSFYYNKRKYQECIPFFEKSVSLNPLQQLVWLRLGYAALQTEEWSIASAAYKRYTALEPDNFEVWNNLAQAHIKLGNKKSAHQALIEALRCNFDNWKVWENLVNVSAAILHISDLIRGYHRVLDVKEKYLNIQVLCIMVRTVSQNEKDSEGRSCGILLPKARELLGRLVAIYPGEGILWELYAELSPDAQAHVQRLQRAYRGYVKTLNWQKDINCVQCVLHICAKLGTSALNEEINENDPIVDSVRLNLNSAIAAIKKEMYEDTKEALVELEGLLNKITDKKAANTKKN